jgi:hypothetical protein
LSFAGCAPGFLIEHDLFGKPVSTFPDHALAMQRRLVAQRRREAVQAGVAIPLALQRLDGRDDVLAVGSRRAVPLPDQMQLGIEGQRPAYWT